MIPPSFIFGPVFSLNRTNEDAMPKAALSCAALLLATALWGPAAAAELLSGAAAYGDFTQDAPGNRRHIAVTDLPAPSKGVPNMSSMVPPPDGALPRVPAGFKVEPFAQL